MSVENRHKLAQVRAYMRVAADKQHPLHKAIEAIKGNCLKRGASWMAEAENTIKEVCRLEDIKRDNYKLVTSLKNDDPDLSVFLGVGGPSDISLDFSSLVNSTEMMEEFASNAARYLRDSSLGRYGGHSGTAARSPRNRKYHAVIPNTSKDWEGEWLRRGERVLSRSFDEESSSTGLPVLRLALAISGDRDIIDTAYDINALQQSVNFVLVKAYDFYTSEFPLLGHHAAIYPSENDQGFGEDKNVDFAIQYLLYLGVPSTKLIMGLPSHGRSFKFLNESEKYFGALHGGNGVPGPYSQIPGILTYYETCDLLNKGWTSSFHEEHQVPFAFSSEEIVTYDDVGSMTAKVGI
ncbi:chitotriosidase-1-like [Aplysia californica]|uniref:Chitotriosidase-1-like n=1 Tax=Aplysia californica TaxID=6500 RepID=A0ABM1VXS0_APLCA|nr:chitotriosidase-1-like [Aplysia californica]